MKVKHFDLKQRRSPEETADMLAVLAAAQRGEVVCTMPVEMALVEMGGDNDDLTAVEFTLSTASPDRYDDVVHQDQWDLDNWTKNPVVLWGHDYDQPPVGKGSNPRLDESGNLKATATFTPKSLYPFGHMIGEMVKQGFLSAVSVGFFPNEWTFNEERGGFDFLTNELWEFSVVNIPANPEALAAMKAAGIQTEPLFEEALRILGAPDSNHRALWVPPDMVNEAANEPVTLTISVGKDGVPVMPEKSRGLEGDGAEPNEADPRYEGLDDPDALMTDEGVEIENLTDDVAELAKSLATLTSTVDDLKRMTARLITLNAGAGEPVDEPADDDEDLTSDQIRDIVTSAVKQHLATAAGRLS